MVPNQRSTDEEFIAAWKRLGSPTLVADKLGVSARQIYLRRKTIQQRYGIELQSWNDLSSRRMTLKKGEGRIDLNIENGTVIVFSDAHFWPQIRTTAFRALLALCKQLRPVAIVCNGDAFDGATASRWPDSSWMDRAKKPTVKDELLAVQERLGEIEKANKCDLFWPLGNHDCLDTQTECLTKRGWVKYNEILLTDEILSLDGDKAVWSSINEMLCFPYKGELVRIEKTRMSMAVTPNHRVLLNRMDWRTRSYSAREYRLADDLPSGFNIPMAAETEATGVALEDAAIALTGWILTDGSIDDYNISIYQSKPEGREKIETILNSLGLQYSTYIRQRGMKAICGRALLKEPIISAQYLIKAESTREVLRWCPEKGRLPDWAFDLDARQFNVLLDALVDGDGVWDGYNPEGKTCCVIYGQEQILSSIQAVAVTHGWRARVSLDNRGDYRLCMAKEPKIRVDRPEVFREEYEGKVWCLRVPLENFMVRRNGCAYFTGNSRYETKLAAVAPEFEGVMGFTLKEHFPSWKPCWTLWVNGDTQINHYYHSGIHDGHNNLMKGMVHAITGHTHSLKVSEWTDASSRTIYAMNTGTLADALAEHNVNYQRGLHGNHRSGFGVLTYWKGQLLRPELVSVLDEDLVQFRGHVLSADTGAVQR